MAKKMCILTRFKALTRLLSRAGAARGVARVRHGCLTTG